MEGMIVLLSLLILAFPVIAIVALVKVLNANEELRALQRRVAALETGQAHAPGTAAAAPSTSATIEMPAPPAPVVEQAPPAPAEAAPKPEPAAPAAAPEAVRPAASFEEKFGTRWVVWIGGLALALGAIFLVRYSIEEGLIGPGVRIFLASLFSAALIAAGEWARRNEIASNVGAIPSQHIPSILTAAGTVAAYATVYAAYALYGFLPPPLAFILLGVVALATLAAALLHGPALAGLGLAGAFIAPALVAADDPSYWALYLYLTVVTAAAFALARLRLWRWLAITAVVLGAMWLLVGIDYPEVEALGAHLFFTVAGFALAAALIVSGLWFGPNPEPGQPDRVSSGVIAAYLLCAMLLVIGSMHAPSALIVFALLTAATVAIAWRTDAALYTLPVAGILVILVMLHWTAPTVFEDFVMPGGPAASAGPQPSTGSGWHIVLGAFFAVLFGGSAFASVDRSDNLRNTLLWCVTGVIAPIAILIALYLRIAEFDRSIPFAGVALLLAALFGYATELLSKREPTPSIAASAAVFATGAIASLALTLTFALDKGWLTVGLALMVPGIAWVSEQRPLPALRYLAAAVIVLVLLRIGYEPRIVGDDIGTTPVFNWLLYGYGVPALSFWVAGYLLRRRADDVPARMADSAAILFTVLLAFLEIRHTMNNGDIFQDSPALAEVALQICVGLAMTIGLERLRERTQSIVHNFGALILALLTFAAIVFGPLIGLNPMVTGRSVGTGVFFNLILLAYGLPAILAAVLALMARTTRPLAYRSIAAALAVGLSLAYLSLEIRDLYHGPELWRGATTNVEQYTYSAVWLAFGVALLVAGLFLRSQPARLASAAVVLITIGKVFLVDMSDLTGIFQALSFIGLGIVLVGIGWLYQRLLFPARKPPEAPQATP